MHFNCSFDTYKRETSGSKRQHSTTKTITGGSGYYEPTGGDLRAVLGLSLAVKAYTLLTYETGIDIGDKVVISSATYYVESIEQQNAAPTMLNRAVLIIKEL